jgi:chromosomal replication initiator protein
MTHPRPHAPSPKAEKLWSEVLEGIKTRITAGAYETWFSDTQGLTLGDEKIIVGVPNEFYIDWLEEHYADLVREILRGQGFKGLKIVYSPAPKEREAERKPAPRGFRHPRNPQTLLLPRYNFNRFVVGKSNQFAYAAAQAVCKSPSNEYNPLFIYGKVGLGKTHLLHAIGNGVMQGHSSLQVYVTSAESFMSEMIRAIQRRAMVSFKLKYRQLDVLLIDDIQFLSDKEMLQEEIFHTFNSLHGDGKQIVMTSDRPPKEIPALEERLVSRFHWGLVVDIRPPDLEHRMAILEKKAADHRLTLNQDVAEYIARRVRSSIRELEGCITRLVAYHSMNGDHLDRELVAELLAPMFEDSRGIDLDTIVEAVSKEFGIPVRDIRGKSRRGDIVLARQTAIYLSRTTLGTPLKRIGSYFGGRDHSTVIHSVEKATGLLDSDASFARRVGKIRKELGV